MLQPNSFNIAPIELKPGLWIKDGKVNIPTKFQENLRNLDFLVQFMHYVIYSIFMVLKYIDYIGLNSMVLQ